MSAHVVAHAGHGSWWLDMIWLAPVLIFVVWISVNALRDRKRVKAARERRGPS
jgi:hypothetical protein